MDAKTIYAQSSDIKSRTYLEYRKDMKKKAIAELEMLGWLKNKIPFLYPNQKVEVLKSGGDAFLWFLRKGGVTREPDYIVKINDKNFDIEFQYAENTELRFFDFAVSKIGKKDKHTGERKAHQNRKILYVAKNISSFAFIEPSWILENGEIGFVDAWRKDAYRVPREKFLKILTPDENIKAVIETIDIKNNILNFQHNFLTLSKNKLSYLLQQVIDEQKIVEIIPNDLDSFFRVCFILNHLDKIPRNAVMWLVYLLSFISTKNTTDELSKILYCVDFLYTKIELNDNEINMIVDKIHICLNLLKGMEQKDGSFRSSKYLSPMIETINAVFCLNLIEDLTQDMIHYYSVTGIQKIEKIYQSLGFLCETQAFIKNSRIEELAL